MIAWSSPPFLIGGYQESRNTQKAVLDWSQRQKLSFSLLLEHSHNWQQVVPASLHAEHPDWLAEFGGKPRTECIPKADEIILPKSG